MTLSAIEFRIDPVLPLFTYAISTHHMQGPNSCNVDLRHKTVDLSAEEFRKHFLRQNLLRDWHTASYVLPNSKSDKPTYSS